MKEFHISYASSSGDRVDILSKVPDEEQQTISGTNEGAGDKLKVPDVPEYRSKSEEESWTFSYGEDEEENKEHDSDDDNDDNDDEDDDQEHDNKRTESDDSGDDFVYPNLSTYKADEEEEEKEEEKAKDDDEDDDTMGGEQEDEEDEELTRVKKILMDKMEENKSIDRSDVQKNLYKALLKAYNFNKDLLSSYGEVVTLKRGRDDQDKDKEPSAGSNRGSKQRRSGKEESSKETTQKVSKSTSSSKGVTRSPPKSSAKSNQEEEHKPRVADLEEPLYHEFDIGNDVSPVIEVTNVDERLWNPSGSQNPDRKWNQTKTVDDRPPQQWMTKLAQASDLLTGPIYDLIKGTCKSVVELEYHLEEVFKAANDQLDWHNPKGRPYPHDLSKPLPLIPDARGRLIILYDHFINNDLEYLKGGSSSRKYTTSITKIKATDYGHIKWIEDKIPRSTWCEAQVVYDKHAYWGTYL
ncbi:hypothetical protein Tco_0808921 [Tanacetum coccineum]